MSALVQPLPSAPLVMSACETQSPGSLASASCKSPSLAVARATELLLAKPIMS